jgi:hypothetical protein
MKTTRRRAPGPVPAFFSAPLFLSIQICCRGYASHRATRAECGTAVLHCEEAYHDDAARLRRRRRRRFAATGDAIPLQLTLRQEGARAPPLRRRSVDHPRCRTECLAPGESPLAVLLRLLLAALLLLAASAAPATAAIGGSVPAGGGAVVVWPPSVAAVDGGRLELIRDMWAWGGDSSGLPELMNLTFISEDSACEALRIRGRALPAADDAAFLAATAGLRGRLVALDIDRISCCREVLFVALARAGALAVAALDSISAEPGGACETTKRNVWC